MCNIIYIKQPTVAQYAVFMWSQNGFNFDTLKTWLVIIMVGHYYDVHV